MADGDGQDRVRSYRRAADRREQVIAQAIDLFAEQGVETSLRAIGDAIGVSHAALRYHFPSRDELLVAVYRAHEIADHDRAAPNEGPAAEDVSAVATLERSALRNREVPGLVELYATLSADALQADRHPVTHEFVKERFRRVRAELAALVQAGQQAGAIASDIDAADAAALVVAASDGLQIQWLLDPDAVDVGGVLRMLERLLPGTPS